MHVSENKNLSAHHLIPHFLSERLMHLRDAQNDLRIELEDLWQGDNWIFTQDNLDIKSALASPQTNLFQIDGFHQLA